MYEMIDVVTIKNYDGTETEGMYFHDSRLYVSDKKTALVYIEKLKAFYELDAADEWIEKQNKKLVFRDTFLIHGFKYDEENKVYLYKKPEYDKRKPKLKVANKWGFKCSWCGETWSSDEKDYYFQAYFTERDTYSKVDSKSCCSEDCAKHMSIDIQKEWIYENGFSHLFKKE